MVNSTKTATTSPVETTNYNTTESGINSTQLDSTKMYDKKDVNISFGYNTTEYAKESTVYKDSINNNSNSWVTPVAISLGLFVIVCVIGILVIFYYKKGKTFYNFNAFHCHVKYENRFIIKK